MAFEDDDPIYQYTWLSDVAVFYAVEVLCQLQQLAC